VIVNRDLRIVSFSSDGFNKAKMNNQYISSALIDIFSDYDVIAIQDINDNTGTAINNLIDKMPSYYMISRDTYAFIYKRDITIRRPSVFDLANSFENPPYLVQFTSGDFDFVVAQVRTEKTNTQEEIRRLQFVVEYAEGYYEDKDIFIVGNLHADCNYYETNTYLNNYEWIIGNGADTTVDKSDCAYDRIITTEHYGDFILKSGVDYYYNR